MMRSSEPINSAVLSYLREHADGDGVINQDGVAIAASLAKPKRTIQKALKRLETKGTIVSPVRRQFVIVELADLGDL